MVLPRARLRSKAGMPFNLSQSCTVPIEWTEFAMHVQELAPLLQHRWIEVHLLDTLDMPVSSAPPPDLVTVRVRAVRQYAPQATPVGQVDAQTRVLAITERELAALRANPRLETRLHDRTLFPTRVFTRIRARAESGATVGMRWYPSTWHAYDLPFDDFSGLRFEPALEVELLEPEAGPPLERVRLRSTTGKPFVFLRQVCPAQDGVEVDLYPREIERARDLGWLAVERIVAKRATTEPGQPPRDAEAPALESAAAPPTAAAASDDTHPAPDSDLPAETTDLALEARIRRWATNAATCIRGHKIGGYLLDEILGDIGVEESKRTRSVEMELASVLRKLGWEHLPMQRRDGKRVRPYLPPRT